MEYWYDAAGNLTLKIDPRTRVGGVTLPNCPVPYAGGQVATCYEYDSLNRIKSRKYNDGTPDVTYAYDDAAVANSLGRLTSVGSSMSTYSHGAYDVMGRVKSSSQTTGGVTYSMPEYKYDLAGNLTSEKYPSGRVVETKYDAAGRAAGVTNPATGLFYAGAPSDSANRIQYTAAGAPSSMRLGNGLWEHTAFNTRLQPTQIGLGISASDSSVMKLGYTYGELVNGTLDPTRNNGNVQSQTITVPGLASPLAQSYKYDALNRLEVAEEKSGASTTWKQVYSYNKFGNRNFAAGTTSPDYSQTPNDPATGLPVDPVRNPVFDQSNNRIMVTAAGQGDYRYDAAGNLLCEPRRLCTQGQTSVTPYYAYDAENRMKSAGSRYSGGGTSYSYDGDGRRVRKSTYNGEDTVFIYDALESLVAEYSSRAEANGTRYLTQDNLGSTRVVTGEDGDVISRHDNFPFGEEIRAGVGGRTTTQGYSQLDGVRQGFTGYEEDSETGLDYAQARYYSPPQGRYTSPDPYSIVGEVQAERNPEKARRMLDSYLSEPQQWNRYAYVINNPLRHVDPTGEVIFLTGTAEEQQQELERIKKLLGPERFKYVKVGTFCDQTLGNVTTLSYDSNASNMGMERIGNTELDKELSVRMADILESDEVVEYKIATSYVSKDGVPHSVAEWGGAVTVGKGDSQTGHVQIFVHPNGDSIAEDRLNTIAGADKWAGASHFDFYPDIVDSHEFGHAHEAMIGGQPRSELGNRKAVRMENAIRERRGLKSRRVRD